MYIPHLMLMAKCLVRRIWVLAEDLARMPTTRELIIEEEWFGVNNVLQVTEDHRE